MNTIIEFETLDLIIDFIHMETYPEFLYITRETKDKLKSLILYDIDFEKEYIIINNLIFIISNSSSFDIIGKKGIRKMKKMEKLNLNGNRLRI